MFKYLCYVIKNILYYHSAEEIHNINKTKRRYCILGAVPSTARYLTASANTAVNIAPPPIDKEDPIIQRDIL